MSVNAKSSNGGSAFYNALRAAGWLWFLCAVLPFRVACFLALFVRARRLVAWFSPAKALNHCSGAEHDRSADIAESAKERDGKQNNEKPGDVEKPLHARDANTEAAP